jgi:hypothetical protein
MKKTILTYGLISGVLCSLMMIATIPFEDAIGFARAEWLGYTLIVLSFLLVFFGIRSWRDNAGNGHVTFVRAFTIGLAITLITCAFYVLTWEIMYFAFMPDFLDKYSAYMVDKARAAGASPAALQAQIDQLSKYKQLYNNPLYNIAVTFLEPFPVGLVMTLLSAAILRKKPQPQTVHAHSQVS